MKHYATDADFRAALAPGAGSLLDALIGRLQGSVTAHLKQLRASPDEAEEVFYIGIEVLWWKGRGSGYPPGFNFYAYLLQTCKQQWYNELRRRKNRPYMVTPAEVAVLNLDPSIQEILEIVEFNNRLFQYVDRLGDPCRQLLLLWAEGHSFEEIARLMGYKDADSARQQKYKCLERLKKTIGENGLND